MRYRGRSSFGGYPLSSRSTHAPNSSFLNRAASTLQRRKRSARGSADVVAAASMSESRLMRASRRVAYQPITHRRVRGLPDALMRATLSRNADTDAASGAIAQFSHRDHSRCHTRTAVTMKDDDNASRTALVVATSAVVGGPIGALPSI